MLRFILTGYVENALSQAEYDKLEDGTFSGRIPVSYTHLTLPTPYV